MAARILDAIRTLELTDSSGQAYRITTSMGLGALRGSDRSLRDLLDRADQALYLAKHRGRDQLATLDDDEDDTCDTPVPTTPH